MVTSSERPHVGQAGTTDSIASWSSRKRQVEQIHWQGEMTSRSKMDCLVIATAANRQGLWFSSSCSFL